MIFISHSSADQKLVRALRELLQISLALPVESFRCTSLDDGGLDGGAEIDDQLRTEIQTAEAFIGLISNASLQSMYVMLEIGARWGTRKHLIPLLAPGVPLDTIKPPLQALNALRCENAGHLRNLVSGLARTLRVQPVAPSVYQQAMDRLLALPAAKAPVRIPKQLREQLEQTFSERKRGIGRSQGRILEFLEQELIRKASVPQELVESAFEAEGRSVYWRLEALAALGFIEKEVTAFSPQEHPRFNYRMTEEYRAAVAAAPAAPHA